MILDRLEIYDLIDAERYRQYEKWGNQRHDMTGWMLILMEEVGELSREVLEDHFKKFYMKDPDRADRIKKELIQVAAVCVQILESTDL